MSFFRRRLSKSDRDRDRYSHHSDRGPISPTSPPTSYNVPSNFPSSSHDHPQPQQRHPRPVSATAMSDASYDFAHPTSASHHHQQQANPTNPTNTSHRFANNPPPAQPSTNATNPTSNTRPLSHPLPNSTNTSTLSRTDQVVLRYFWAAKQAESEARDLHYLKFPSFTASPSARELTPFCEIYSLVKSSPGAEIVGLGTLPDGAGTFIGFELSPSTQLHIDLSTAWTVPIAHHRVSFKPWETFLSEANQQGSTVEREVKGWERPVTIEMLEGLWEGRWKGDLGECCWEGRGVRELGGDGGGEEGDGEGMDGGVGGRRGQGVNGVVV